MNTQTGSRHKNDFILSSICWVFGDIFAIGRINAEQGTAWSDKSARGVDFGRTWIYTQPSKYSILFEIGVINIAYNTSPYYRCFRR